MMMEIKKIMTRIQTPQEYHVLFGEERSALFSQVNELILIINLKQKQEPDEVVLHEAAQLT